MRRMEFGVLGPFEALVDQRPTPIPRGRQRVLLATLVLHTGEVVGVDELLERMWGDRLPGSPRGALQICLTRVRRWLDVQGEGAARLLTTESAGYVLRLPPQNVDLLRFRDSLRAAEAAAERGDLVGQWAALATVLSLWRGPVLADVHSDSLQQDVIPRITEEYLRALEWRHEVGFALGRHDRLVGELLALTRKYPYRERYWGQLMRALCRCGRQVEALDAYRRVRTRLREEIGVDPGPELRRLHVAILRNDPAGVPHGAR